MGFRLSPFGTLARTSLQLPLRLSESVFRLQPKPGRQKEEDAGMVAAIPVRACFRPTHAARRKHTIALLQPFRPVYVNTQVHMNR